MRDNVFELYKARLLAFPRVSTERQLADRALETVDVERPGRSELACVAGFSVPWNGNEHVPAVQMQFLVALVAFFHRVEGHD